MVSIKKSLRLMDGDPKMHDSWIRSRMITQGFRPELVNRIGLACDFNDITPKDALSIAKGMFALEAQALLVSRTVVLQVEDSVAKTHAADVFDPDYGARGIRRCVDSTLQSIMSNRQIALAVGPGSSMRVSSELGVLRAVVTGPDGVKVEASIVTQDSSKDLARLARAQSMVSRVHVEKNAPTARVGPDHEETLRTMKKTSPDAPELVRPPRVKSGPGS